MTFILRRIAENLVMIRSFEAGRGIRNVIWIWILKRGESNLFIEFLEKNEPEIGTASIVWQFVEFLEGKIQFGKRRREIESWSRGVTCLYFFLSSSKILLL